MPKPKLPPADKKRNMMGFYETDARANKIARAANLLNISVAEWLRRAADKQLKEGNDET